VDAVSQSFVSSAGDIDDVRATAAAEGFSPFIIAKIERAAALVNFDEILDAADGIMIARGDLGVEIPIERIAMVQKDITAKANLAGKPVITATQMLESMTRYRRPSRAEATDVANAVLDGTDCVMLSEESATGNYPLEAVAMLVKIAAAAEPLLHRRPYPAAASGVLSKSPRHKGVDLISATIENLMGRIDSPAAILSPTVSGYTARSLSRFRLPVWILAVNRSSRVSRELLFSFGVLPVQLEAYPEDWTGYVRDLARDLDIPGRCFVLAEGPSAEHPEANYRIEIVDLQS
jgi:pyruvate kinase